MTEQACRFVQSLDNDFCEIHNSSPGICDIGLAALRARLHAQEVFSRINAETALGTLLDRVQITYPDVTAVDVMPIVRRWFDDVFKVRIEAGLELGNGFISQVAALRRQLEEKGSLITDCFARFDAVLTDKPMPNGEYVHHIFCSGDRRVPPGTPKNTCCCMPERKKLLGKLDEQARVMGRVEQTVKNAIALLDEVKAQWGEDYLWKKWGMSERLSELKALSPEPKKESHWRCVHCGRKSPSHDIILATAICECGTGMGRWEACSMTEPSGIAVEPDRAGN